MKYNVQYEKNKNNINTISYIILQNDDYSGVYLDWR
jgi:hypothetical protein